MTGKWVWHKIKWLCVIQRILIFLHSCHVFTYYFPWLSWIYFPTQEGCNKIGRLLIIQPTYTAKVRYRYLDVFSTQWTHLCQLAKDSASKFCLESSSRFHRFWGANPLRNYHMDLIWKCRRRFEFQNINLPGFFYVVSTSNQLNCCAYCFQSIICLRFLLREPILINLTAALAVSIL